MAVKEGSINCDNQSVADIWQRGTSHSPDLMALVLCVFLTAARNNYTVFINHIPGPSNVIADALSRSQMHRFRTLDTTATTDKPVGTPGPSATYYLTESIVASTAAHTT